MSFLITWLIISFITFASRYSGAVLNLKFYICPKEGTIHYIEKGENHGS